MVNYINKETYNNKSGFLSSLIKKIIIFIMFFIIFSVFMDDLVELGIIKDFTVTLIILISFFSILILETVKNQIFFSQMKEIIVFSLIFSPFVIMPLLNSRVSIMENIQNFYVVSIYPILIFIIYYISHKEKIFIKIVGKLLFFLEILSSMIYLLYLNIGLTGRNSYAVLSISDLLSFFLILNLILNKNKKTKYILSFSALILIFLYQSFTSIVFLSFTLIIYFFIDINENRNRHIFSRIILNYLLIIFVIFLGFFLINITKGEYNLIKSDNFFAEIYNSIVSRIYNLSNNNDLSKIARDMLNKEGFKILKERPFFGEYLYYKRIFGTTGGYMHNFLSFWAAYGLGPFIIIFFFYFFFLYKIYINYRKNKDIVAKALFYSSIYVTFSILFSRSFRSTFFYIQYALMFSHYFNFIKSRRLLNHPSS